MRRTAFIIAVGLLAATVAVPAFAAGDDALLPHLLPHPFPAGTEFRAGPTASFRRRDLKEARNAFTKGVKLQDQRRTEEAFAQFDTAAQLAPQNMQFLTAREVVKAQLVFNHVQRGNILMLENARAQAAAEFRKALDLDAENQFVRERLAEASRELAPVPPRAMPVQIADSGEIHLEPEERAGDVSLQRRGSRTVRRTLRRIME